MVGAREEGLGRGLGRVDGVRGAAAVQPVDGLQGRGGEEARVGALWRGEVHGEAEVLGWRVLLLFCLFKLPA